MDQIRLSEDLKSLHTDERFGKLFPKAEAFAVPFVEKVKIIHGDEVSLSESARTAF
jgi:hypothetical protein